MHILLIDDHALFRQGLKYLLEDLEERCVFHEAGDVNQALAILGREEINLVLLDLNMPGTSGMDALQSVLSSAPGVPVTILSGETEPGLIRRLIESGASGFVPKSSNTEILLPALQLILAGGVYLPPVALSDVGAEAPVKAEPNGSSSLLSERQTAVLLRAIQGQPNKVIALELGIAEGTVKTHLSGAYKVLGGNNRTEAVFAAARLGITPEAVPSA